MGALGQDAVDRHADAVVAAAGRIDAVFDGVGVDNGEQGVCLRPTGMPEAAAKLGSHTREVWSRAAARQGMTLEEMLPLVSAGSPLGRALTVAEVADVAAFLPTDRASGMTGHCRERH